jgi:hypothetical protein
VNVFNLATAMDSGGQMIRTKEAFDRLAPGWSMRSMAALETFIAYPYDLPWRGPLLERFYDAADVVHLHNTLHGHDWYDAGAGKPTVLHYHGTIYRAEHASIAAEARRVGAVQMASTIDLAVLEPDVAWLPSPFDLGALRAVREREYVPTRRLRIAHAPTNRDAKQTDAFLDALRSLATRHDFELDLIEGQRWIRCLARKARADIFYDQAELGYGNNSVEAWAMGIPVVSGVSDPAVREAMIQTWGRLPFVDAAATSIAEALEQVITDAGYRAEMAAIGLAHVERWHDEARVVPMLQTIYASAGPTLPGGSSRRGERSRWATGRTAAVAGIRGEGAA